MRVAALGLVPDSYGGLQYRVVMHRVVGVYGAGVIHAFIVYQKQHFIIVMVKQSSQKPTLKEIAPGNKEANTQRKSH